MESFEVTADELDRFQFEEPQKGHQLTASLAAFSFAVALLIPLLTQGGQLSDKMRAIFIALVVVGFVLFFFFGANWIINFRHRDVIFRRIRARKVGPVGEQGGEIRPEDLDDLPSEDATGATDVTSGPETKG